MPLENSSTKTEKIILQTRTVSKKINQNLN